MSPDFRARDEMFRKRMDALDAAIQKSRSIGVALNFVTALVFTLAIILLWSVLSVKVLIGIAAGTFAFRWIANIVVHLKFTRPAMAKIDREFPEPPKRASLP